MSEENVQPGRKLVRKHFLEPLLAEGLVRKPTTPADEHKVFIDKLLDRLAYMTAHELERLVPIVRSACDGRHRNRWPSLATITNFAHRMHVPPDRSDDVLFSWLHSRAGVLARERGVVLGTRWFIKTYRWPPRGQGTGESYDETKIREHSEELSGTAKRLNRKVADGEATTREREWLEGYYQAIADCDAIVDAGIEYRKRQAAEAAAELKADMASEAAG